MSRREKTELARETLRTREVFERSVEIGSQIARDNDETGRRLAKAKVIWDPAATTRERNIEYETLLRNIALMQEKVRGQTWVERKEEERLIKEISESSSSDVARLIELHRQLRELETREIEIYKPRLREASIEYRNAVVEFEDFVYAK